MIYLLDTNACVAVINGRPPAVRVRLAEAIDRDDSVAVSSLVLFELWYGVAKSSRPDDSAVRLNTFLSGPMDRIVFDEDDAAEAGEIRARLEGGGQPIGAYDVLIAGQARRRGATLVTANAREFRRVPGLAWEDWARRSGSS